MEREPDTENVVYIDEYPHLAQKVRLRHLGEAPVRQFVLPVVVELKKPPEPPDPAA